MTADGPHGALATRHARLSDPPSLTSHAVYFPNLVRRTDYISRLLHDVDEHPRSASAAPTMGAGDELHRSVSAIDLVSFHDLNPLARRALGDPPAARRRLRLFSASLAFRPPRRDLALTRAFSPRSNRRARKGTATAATATTASSTGASSSPGTTARAPAWRNPPPRSTRGAHPPATSTPSTPTGRWAAARGTNPPDPTR